MAYNGHIYLAALIAVEALAAAVRLVQRSSRTGKMRLKPRTADHVLSAVAPPFCQVADPATAAACRTAVALAQQKVCRAYTPPRSPAVSQDMFIAPLRASNMPPTHWLRGRMDPSHTCGVPL